MYKKFMACVLAFSLLLLTACSAGGEVDEMQRIGDTESRDPLRICVDLQAFKPADPTWAERAYDDLLYRLEQTAGLEDVVIEVVPQPEGDILNRDTTARVTAIDRIRSEIMAGGGPDVFLQMYFVYAGPMGYEFDETDCLFKYPQKAMENGIFLPLDELIENNTEFTEWDKLTQPVLEAGRNKEGQQLIPLSYTFPLLCYPKSEWEHIPDKKYTWNDMLTNPELLPYSLDLANCGQLTLYTDMTTDTPKNKTEFFLEPGYLEHIMGEFADFEKEELCFTEEELLARVNEIRALEKTDAYEEFDDARELGVGLQLSERTLNKPMTFLPIYNMDGGITAHIQNFAAVNRNTKRPEDAFRVIDLLMSKYVQRVANVYNELIYGMDGIPMHEELFQESDPLIGNNYYMRADNYEAFCKVREQITGANFNSEGLGLLSSMMGDCMYESNLEFYGKTVEEVVHDAYEDMQRRVKE